jgi:hypothetical protein
VTTSTPKTDFDQVAFLDTKKKSSSSSSSTGGAATSTTPDDSKSDKRPTSPTPKKSHPMTRPEPKMNQLKKMYCN